MNGEGVLTAATASAWVGVLATHLAWTRGFGISPWAHGLAAVGLAAQWVAEGRAVDEKRRAEETRRTAEERGAEMGGTAEERAARLRDGRRTRLVLSWLFALTLPFALSRPLGALTPLASGAVAAVFVGLRRPGPA